jgi:hypothetical protein
MGKIENIFEDRKLSENKNMKWTSERKCLSEIQCAQRIVKPHHGNEHQIDAIFHRI